VLVLIWNPFFFLCVCVCVCMNGVNGAIAVNDVNKCNNDLMIGTIIFRGGEMSRSACFV
jgi:hypothetical protein